MKNNREPIAKLPVPALTLPTRFTRNCAAGSGAGCNIILVCGGSCSGKTTLAHGLKETLRQHGTTGLLSMDNYYHDLSDQSPAQTDSRNFDHPDAVNIALLQEHLRQLAHGCPVPRQIYDFKTHRITKPGEMITPADYLLVEGIFALYFKELRSLAAAAIFIRADADLRLARRVLRDTSARRLPLQLVIRQYLKDVRPMHVKYIEPYASTANLTLDSGTRTVKRNLNLALNFILENIHGK